MSRRLRALVRPTIRTRLALVYGGVFFAAGLCLMAVSYGIVDHSLSPSATGGAVARFVAYAPAGVIPTPPPAKTGVQVGPPPGLSAPGSLSAPGPLGEPGPMGEPVMATAPVSPATSGAVRGGLQLLITDVRVATLRSLLWTWAAMIGLMAGAAGAFGWLLSARMLRPLREITGTARRLSVANLHERIRLDGPQDELTELADTFDGMLGRLEAAFASQRRFAASASHELRTPLAIMRAQVDVALSDPGVDRAELLHASRAVRDAVDRCERLLDGLLVLARSDRGLDAADTVDLAESAARALQLVTAAAAERGIELRSELASASVSGDPALLDRMVGNLVENAVAYNLSPGWVEVTTGNGGRRARVRVANSGPNVPPGQVASLFEPFRRLSAERTGSGRGAGLGLSIVRSVARAHGGDATVVARLAGGLTVEVDLPGRPATD